MTGIVAVGRELTAHKVPAEVQHQVKPVQVGSGVPSGVSGGWWRKTCHPCCSYKTFEDCSGRLRGFFSQLAPADVEQLKERLEKSEPSCKASGTKTSNKCMTFEFAAASLLDALNPESSEPPPALGANSAEPGGTSAGDALCVLGGQDDPCCKEPPEACGGCADIEKETASFLSCCGQEVDVDFCLEEVKETVQHRSVRELTRAADDKGGSFYCIDVEREV